MQEFKILHTADWHLGKKLFKQSRLVEQEVFLNDLYQKVIDYNINLLLIAGDIFDVPSPPFEAQKLFYDFIYKIGKIENFQTIIITGNHDSQALFEVPKHFFQEHNCHIFSHLSKNLDDLNLIIPWGNLSIGIKSLPYFRNNELLGHIPETNIEKMKEFFEKFFSRWEKQPDFRILLSHHCFGKYSAAGSEHAIFLSGMDYFPLDWIKEKFDYIALGHIHKKQTITKTPLTIYPGSPYPLRFSEGNDKYISLLSIKEDKSFTQEYLQIQPYKYLLRLNTSLESWEDDIQELIKHNKDKKAFLEVQLQTDRPNQGIPDLIRKRLIKTTIELLSFRNNIQEKESENLSLRDIEELNLSSLFNKYYKEKFATDIIPNDIKETFKELLQDVQNHDKSDEQ